MSGELQAKLATEGLQPATVLDGEKRVEWNGYDGDPFEFVPKWLSFNPLRSK